jgi:alkylation response protein AidB-like acyl-CoA dehydrogenase
MDPYFAKDHYDLVREVRGFALEVVGPGAGRFDREESFPWESVRAIGERGWLGVPVPKEFGGLGLDLLSYLLVIQELAAVDASHAITVSAHTTLGTSPILDFGTDVQKQRYVPLLARGEVLGGFGLTEAEAGSDAGATRTRAVREREGWRLNGAKRFITHAGVGEIFTVTAVSEPGRGTSGITSFIVTKPTVDPEAAGAVGMGSVEGLGYTPGVRSGRKEEKMGWRASDTRELLLEDARVGPDGVLGGPGEGFSNFMRTLDAGRVGLAALSLGLAEGAIRAASEYTEKRVGFGREVFALQSERFRLAELATELQAARHLTYHAAWLMSRGRSFRLEAAMAKLHASELSMKAAGCAVELMGQDGFSDEFPVERMFRDAKVSEIGEGTSEIQKIVISRALAERYSSNIHTSFRRDAEGGPAGDPQEPHS